MTPAFDEPSIPPRLRRPLAAIWISLGLHAALIALVQVAPPASTGAVSTIEARLVPAQSEAGLPGSVEPVRPESPEPGATALSPVEAADAVPVAAPADAMEASAPSTADVPAPAGAPPASPAARSTAGISVPVDLTFYAARELDVQPRARGRIEPVYPDEADRRHLSGRVKLQLKLEADGRVSDIEVVEAEPPGIFDESALRAFRGARFMPGQKNGRAVRALLLIEVEYDWAERR